MVARGVWLRVFQYPQKLVCMERNVPRDWIGRMKKSWLRSSYCLSSYDDHVLLCLRVKGGLHRTISRWRENMGQKLVWQKLFHLAGWVDHWSHGSDRMNSQRVGELKLPQWSTYSCTIQRRWGWAASQLRNTTVSGYIDAMNSWTISRRHPWSSRAWGITTEFSFCAARSRGTNKWGGFLQGHKWNKGYQVVQQWSPKNDSAEQECSWDP